MPRPLAFAGFQVSPDGGPDYVLHYSSLTRGPHYFFEYRLEFIGGVFLGLGLVSNSAGASAASAFSSLVSDLAGRRIVPGSPVNNQVGSPQLPRLRLGRMM